MKVSYTHSVKPVPMKMKLQVAIPLSLTGILLLLHAVGVSLKLQGTTIPNNSLVAFRDLLYTTPSDAVPTNNNPAQHDQALLCLTDLKNCCRSQQRGNWYYPNGALVLTGTSHNGTAFRRNRGSNEMINGRQFYGSVRLWRRFTPRERGRFRCELPSAAEPRVNQTLNVYICESFNLRYRFRIIIIGHCYPPQWTLKMSPSLLLVLFKQTLVMTSP